MLLQLRTLMYLVTAISGFLVSVPVAVTSNRLGGQCLLYGSLQVLGQQPFPRMTPTFGPASLCSLAVFGHVTLILLSSILAFLFAVHSLRQMSKRNDPLYINFGLSLVHLLLHLVVAVLVWLVAGFLTAGFHQFCSTVEETRIVAKCSTLQNINWISMDGHSFHSCFTLAMAASWIAVVLWTIQSACCIQRVYRLKTRKPPRPPEEAAEAEQL